MKTPIVYFRQTDRFDEPELTACKTVFPVVENRGKIPNDSLVIPRYSALPFYKELEQDVQASNSKLINSFAQHNYVANLSYWYRDFEDITPKTWFRLSDALSQAKGALVLKGETNSKKFSWNTHMYASNLIEAGEVYSRLSEDGLIGTQSIVLREFVELKNYGKMISGIPISHEFRCFFYKDKLLTKAYYWANEDVDPEDDIPESFIKDVAARASPHINFWVADVAQTKAGDWIVVELNDGSMSGLSRNSPETLYKELKAAILD
jgi:hypothetical protein